MLLPKKINEKNIVCISRKIIPLLLMKIREKEEFLYVNRKNNGWSYFDLYMRLRGGIYRKFPLVNIDSVGCSHTLGGGCTMCSYEIRTKNKKIDKKKQKKAVDNAINYIEKSNFSYLFKIYMITTGGSFFDPDEIDEDLRRYIFQKIKNIEKDKELLFATESRMEYINDEILNELRFYFKDSKILIGFGIESCDFLIREACVNKRLPVDFYNKIKLLNKFNVIKSAHLILKPPFLTEREAIEDIIFSIKKIFLDRLGDEIVVMIMNLRPYTLTWEMNKIGYYELPSIWSVIEIIKKIGPDLCKKIHFNGIVVSNNNYNNIKIVRHCKDCGGILLPKLIKFKRPNSDMWKDLVDTADRINCKCKKEWKSSINQKEQLPLEHRIVYFLEKMTKKYLNSSIKNLIK